MSWITDLQKMDFTESKSQGGEAEIIDFIFEHLHPVNKFYVDIGAECYGEGIMSNTDHLKDWQGIRIDANDRGNPNTKKLYVTPENIVPFLKSHKVPVGFDFLNIDIDSFDLDVLEEVVRYYGPRVICTEFNGTLDPSTSVKLKYEEGYVWDETNKYGYSFGAAVKFCTYFGYKIILNHINQNLFLIRGDLISIELPVITAEQVF